MEGKFRQRKCEPSHRAVEQKREENHLENLIQKEVDNEKGCVPRPSVLSRGKSVLYQVKGALEGETLGE